MASRVSSRSAPVFQSTKKTTTTTTKIAVCQSSFLRPASPLELRLLNFNQSSAKPMAPNPSVMISAAHTMRLVRSANSSVPTSIAQRIRPPPIEGVPTFFWCASGVSSRTLLAPCCNLRSASM